MIRAILLFSSCWFSCPVWAYETPSQAELNQMSKEMQGAMQNMDPELVKIAGVNARTGWNRGSSHEGKGILSGLKYNSK